MTRPDGHGRPEVWVDLSTAPDSLFFRPVVGKLEAQGWGVWITARDYGETAAIARHCGLSFQVVGRHGGKSMLGKGSAILERAIRLASLARAQRPHVAVSFNSYAQALAARQLGIPLVTVMDYEYQPANHLAFRLASRVIVPEGFDPAALRRQGAREDRIVTFSGLKEDVSLGGFSPDPHFARELAELGVRESDVLVTMRPPPSHSAYHRFDNDLFTEVARWLGQHAGVRIVLLPRYCAQAESPAWAGLPSLVIPERVLDGPNLVWSSDLVVSAGGSMNREAVVMGTPAWTVFGGRMGGVDRRLIAEGRLLHVTSLSDVAGWRAAKKVPGRIPEAAREALEVVTATVLEAVRPERGSRRAAVTPLPGRGPGK